MRDTQNISFLTAEDDKESVYMCILYAYLTKIPAKSKKLTEYYEVYILQIRFISCSLLYMGLCPTRQKGIYEIS